MDYGSRLQFPDRYSWYNASLGYRQYNMEAAGRLFPVFDSAANAQIHALTFTQTFSRRSIDNPTFPTRGMDLSFSVAATPPYSLLGRDAAGDSDPAQKYRWLEYHKWDFQWRQYVPLPKKLVLKTGLEMGYLGSYQPALGTSPFERYVLGGAGIQALGQNGPLGVSYQSLRGYPAQAFDNDGEGYSLYQKAQVELRYALPTGSMFPAWVLGFAEAGNGYNGFKGYKPFDLKRSAGLGIRVQMPSIGLIGVDWGYGFDPLPGTETPSGSRFHFIFGREF
ncbi:MAG: BamA/TamA family outer membrane protein [Bacteroidota bacterium]